LFTVRAISLTARVNIFTVRAISLTARVNIFTGRVMTGTARANIFLTRVKSFHAIEKNVHARGKFFSARVIENTGRRTLCLRDASNQGRRNAMAGTDVAVFATGGSGSSADPYVGWETAPWTLQKRFYFRPGQFYRCASTVNWAQRGLEIAGNGATITCTGSAYVSLETAGAPVFDVTVSDLIIKGSGATACPLKLQGIADSHFTNIHVGDCTAIGISLKFVLTSRFESVSVSINNGYFSTMPADGIVLDERGAGTSEDCVANVFVACTFEGLSGAGIKLVHASSNAFIGGTSEANGYGLYLGIGSDNVNNVFEAIHLEANATADVYCIAILNTFRNLRSGGTVKCGDGGLLAFSNRFVGGIYSGPFTIDGSNNVLENVNLNGTVTDNSTTTRYVGDNGTRPSSIVGSLQTSPFSASPAITGVTGLGAGSAAALTRSSDLAGIVELTAGAGAAATGTLTVTLATTFTGAPAVVLQLVSGTGAWNAGAASPKITALGANSFTIAWSNNAAALTSGSTYRIAYIAIGRR
jgi:hypothetical protein